MEKLLPALFFGGTILFGYEVIRDVTSGSTSMRYGAEVSRAKQPVRFWLAVAMNGFFGVVGGVFFVKGVIDYWG